MFKYLFIAFFSTLILLKVKSNCSHGIQQNLNRLHLFRNELSHDCFMGMCIKFENGIPNEAIV